MLSPTRILRSALPGLLLLAAGRAAPAARQAEPTRPPTLIERVQTKADPEADDWDTEVWNETLGERLKALGKWIEHPAEMDAEAVGELVARDFAGSALRPAELEATYADGAFRVLRGAAADHGLHTGAEGLMAALRSLADGLGPAGEVHTKFKLFEIELGEGVIATRLYYQARNHAPEESVQQSATWRVRWSLPTADDEPPLLRSIALEEFEEVHVAHAGGRLFLDCTASALGANPSYGEQVLPSLDHWLLRISRLVGMSIGGHHGLALGDVDGDDLDDLYVCDAGGLPNRLYLQDADGRLRDVSAEAGLDWLDYSSAALLVDLDGDGDRDAVLATRPLLLLFENDGRARFELRLSLRGPADPMSLSAADYDEDGDLDLYLCGYNQHPDRGGIAGPVPYQDANNGGPNLLLRNEGGFQFTDATAEVGLQENNSRFSFASVWDDFDADGDLDLYVANDFGRNNLYLNDSGTFRDAAGRAGVEDIASGMSVCTGDPNRDGLTDIYVSNMWSSAGNRVTFQRRFTDQHDDETVTHVQRMARGNTLFTNAGDGTFVDDSLRKGVTMGRWSWGSQLADLNNDGWQDAVIANGYFTMEDPDDL